MNMAKNKKSDTRTSEEIVLSAFEETLPNKNNNPLAENNKGSMFSFFKDPFLLAKYINYILAVLVIFAIAITISLIVRSIFDFSPVWMIVTSFLVLLIISPFTRRIHFKVGYKIQARYDKFLERFL